MICSSACATAQPKHDKSWFVERARILSALANPARLQMAILLKEGERCVCEVAAEVGLDMSTTSRHLVQLRQAGILEDERRGNMVLYRLKATCLPAFLECLEGIAAS